MTNRQNPLIIHHRGCSDGICGALVLWLALDKNAEALAAQHGDEPPWDKIDDREVWIVDFSYPRDDLIKMNERAQQLVVFDHHETSAQNCEGLDFSIFDMSRCGARIALDDLIENAGAFSANHERQFSEDLSDLVDYVQDRDLWLWELEDSQEINAWLASYPRDLNNWEKLLEAWRNRSRDSGFIQEGAAIVRQQDQYVDNLVGQAWLGWVEGPFLPMRQQISYEVLVTNSPILQSEVAGELAEEADFGVAWHQIGDGDYVYSLRSKGDVNVAEVAKFFGGGGHAAAAGFKSSKPPCDLFKRVD